MHKTKIVNPSKLFYFLISTFISVLNFLVSQGDRYLGMTAAMTQIPVPTATFITKVPSCVLPLVWQEKSPLLAGRAHLSLILFYYDGVGFYGSVGVVALKSELICSCTRVSFDGRLHVN